MLTKKFSFGKMLIHTILIIFCALCVIPMILVISISLSDESAIVEYGYTLFPIKFSSYAYNYIFSNADTLINSYMVTISVTILGTLFGLILTTSLAYVLSRPDYKYRNVTSFYVFFTMLFSGGLVPWYILIAKYLHMKDTLFVMFVPYLVIAWYVLLMRGFLQTLPLSMLESARIDGASELAILVRIVLPVSKPGLATVGLFYVLMFWNDWWLSLLFIDKKELVSLQYLLYKIMSMIEALTSIKSDYNVNTGNIQLPSQSARMAMVILTAGPILLAFPFFQQYFVRGLTVGSIKG